MNSLRHRYQNITSWALSAEGNRSLAPARPIFYPFHQSGREAFHGRFDAYDAFLSRRPYRESLFSSYFVSRTKQLSRQDLPIRQSYVRQTPSTRGAVPASTSSVKPPYLLLQTSGIHNLTRKIIFT